MVEHCRAVRCPNIEYSTLGSAGAALLPGSGRNQNKGKSASNTPDFQIFKSEILKHSVAKLSSKQRAWNWTAIGFAAGENSAPVHNKRNLRMMELKLRMGWDRGTIEIT